ncbi:MAG: class I SAM-dependent methyltransferase [Dehalococcoidia bacterium]|nr:MAG: class I SAM-dependent methyltransferase [Dehalococcoidia bacterium]
MARAPKPSHLRPENAAAFQLAGVVAGYHLRTPYPAALTDVLQGLMKPRGGRVIELGCGTGELARMIAPGAERVDAVDISGPMLDRARAMPSRTSSVIRWIHSSTEDVDLDGPYALAIAGDALHWMNWEIVLPRLRHALAPDAPLAIVSAVAGERPWSSGLSAIIPKYSAIKDFKRYVLVEELEARSLFEVTGATTVGPEPYERTTDEYIIALHATAGLARERMAPGAASAFDEEVLRLVEPFAEDGLLQLTASADVAWGTPLA